MDYEPADFEAWEENSRTNQHQQSLIENDAFKLIEEGADDGFEQGNLNHSHQCSVLSIPLGISLDHHPVSENSDLNDSDLSIDAIEFGHISEISQDK